MNMRLILLGCLSLSLGCAVTPKAQQGSLPKNSSPEKQIKPAPTPKHEVKAATANIDMEALKANNQKAGAPSFAFVKSYYRLPVANPVGSATRMTGQVIGLPYDMIQLQTTNKRPWALEPVNVSQMDALATILNDLMAAGVKLNEITMADATKIVAAEQNAFAANQTFWPNRSLASGSDILLTWQTGTGIAGNVVVGRAVRTSDGALLALISTPNIGNFTLRTLVLRLIDQSLKTVVAQQ
jgi:hypothetical protein